MPDFEELKKIARTPYGKQRQVFTEPLPTSKDVHITGLVKTLEAIKPAIAKKACREYLIKQGFNVIRIT